MTSAHAVPFTPSLPGSATTSAVPAPVKLAAMSAIALPRAFTARISFGRLISRVAIAAPTFASAAPAALIRNGCTSQLALAPTLALQFASHFASTLQPPSSLPPRQLNGFASTAQWPLQVTFADGPVAVHLPWHLPSKVPLHAAFGAVAEQVPRH